MKELPPFKGGRRLIAGSVAAAVVGLVLTGLGLPSDPRQALFSYLGSFAYWLSLALGSLLLLMALHATKARWSVVLRRLLEVSSLSVWILAALFIPVVLGMGQLFSWVRPSPDLGAEALELLAHKRLYLNPAFFVARAVFYFAAWAVVSFLLYAWSARQDATGALELTVKQRRLGAGGLPLLAFTLSFASFDWLMSLNPLWYSTLFGVYYFAGSFCGAVALLILAATAAQRGGGPLGGLLNGAHFHSLGKLLLAFVAFWGYIAFSQFMLVWIANLPEELPWYQVRAQGPWAFVGVFLALGHFVLPFFLLLSRDLKRRPAALSAVAVWVLFVHWVDVYWVVMPVLNREAIVPHWQDLTAFVGVGGAAVAFATWMLRGRSPMPLRDPYLEESLRYSPP